MLPLNHSRLINLDTFLSTTAGRAGRKLDDVRDKYQKACRKLHLAHNEYVLLIHEATEVEKDYRTILLPNLLENHQTQQEKFITTWWVTIIKSDKVMTSKSSRWPSIYTILMINWVSWYLIGKTCWSRLQTLVIWRQISTKRSRSELTWLYKQWTQLKSIVTLLTNTGSW